MSQIHAAAPHQTNSDSTSQHKVGIAAGHRVKTGGLHLPAHQATSLPHGLKHELLYIPSSTVPSWGGFFNVDIKEKNVNINNVTLQFQLSQFVGTFTGGLVPACYFFTRIEIVQNGQILDTIYGNEQFVRNQMLEWDEDRLSMNNAMGNYALGAIGTTTGVAQRQSLCSTSGSSYFYVPLRCLFDEMKPPIYTDNQYFQLRVYMDTFANVQALATGSITSGGTIQAVNAICKVTRLDQETALHRHNDHAISPHHTIFHDCRYFTTTTQASASSVTVILSSIVGNVTALLFTLRPVGSTTGITAFQFTQIKDFAILDAASANIVGGVPINYTYAANLYNKDNIKSSYHAETSLGVTDNKANFYTWSFSADMVESLSTGRAYTSRKFTGSEQLVINFQSPAAAQVLEVYALVENIHEMSPVSVKKISL